MKARLFPAAAAARRAALSALRYGSPPAFRVALASASRLSPLSADVADEELLLAGPPPAKSAAVPTLLQPRVLIYDGVCHLCHRGVKWVIKVDRNKKIKFCCLQSKAAEPYLRLCGLNREDVLRRVLFVEGPGCYYEGSTAAMKVASYLPLPYSVLSMLLVIPAPLRDAAYDYIAKRRYDWFGKEEQCIVMQEKEMLERFIDREEMLGGSDQG